MSSALTEITFWLCGSGYSPAHRGKPSTTFVIAAQPPWVAICSITIADSAPSLTTRDTIAVARSVSGRLASNWMGERDAELLAVTYFHAVLNLPHHIASLA